MSTMSQTGEWDTDDVRLLAYVHHMAQTAQSTAAKHLFGSFVQQETRRIQANGGFRLSASRHAIGGVKRHHMTRQASETPGG
jgi:hypothetical protein